MYTQLFLDLIVRSVGGWIQYPCNKYVTSLPHQPCRRSTQPKMWPSSHPVPPIQQPETIFQCLMPYYKTIASSRCQEERAHLSLETIVIISLWHQLWFISYTTVILLHYINMSFVLFHNLCSTCRSFVCIWSIP